MCGLVAFCGLAGAGEVWYVDDDAPANFTTIQAAIDAASDGDTIIVRDGYYTGPGNRDIDFKGKAVHLKSENGPENCIIDAQGSEGERHPGFIFQSGEVEDSILEGFTVKHGYAYSGGGVYCKNSSPTITKNTIIDNTATNEGGGIYCYESSPTITSNIIANNKARQGGGIHCKNSSPTITKNTIAANTTSGDGGGIYCYSSSPTITNNTITDNTTSNCGGGMFCLVSSPTMTNNTIIGNRVTGAGGGIFSYGSSLAITNNILTGNVGSSAPQISAHGPVLTVIYSNVAGGRWAAYVGEGCTLTWGPGNIDADPLFADADNGDYHLKSEYGRWDPKANGGNGGWVVDSVTSPCIDAGDPASGYSNEPQPNGGRVNMGAYGNTGEASKSAGYSLVVTTSGSGTGTVQLSPPGGGYESGTTVTLTAVASPGSFFDHWEGDLSGSANPATILMDGHKNVIAYFIYPQLTVLSAPIVDVAITGTRAGSTPYTADCDLHEVVALTAPESVSVGGKTYYFEMWFVDNVSVLPSDERPFNEVEVTMGDGHTVLAQYDWRLPGDYDGNCKINVLDLIYVRNRLGTTCSE